MVKKAQDVYQEALLLSEEERERLALMLQKSFSNGFANPEIEQAWMEEIERREKLHAQGKMGSISWEDLRRELRERHDL